ALTLVIREAFAGCPIGLHRPQIAFAVFTFDMKKLAFRRPAQAIIDSTIRRDLARSVKVFGIGYPDCSYPDGPLGKYHLSIRTDVGSCIPIWIISDSCR